MGDLYTFFSSHYYLGSFDLEQMEFPLLEGSRALVAMLLVLLTYLLYYAFFVVGRPRVVGGRRALREHLLERCPSLRQYYWPTVWAFTCHQTTILRALLQKSPPLQYRRYAHTHTHTHTHKHTHTHTHTCTHPSGPVLSC